jgi:DNA-binding CsgD family transcriptional regulator/DNA-binding transcriptional ArsR family regulator
MLGVLGLDAVSESVYRAMLTRPQDDVAALREHLSLSEAQMSASLDRLSELALVRAAYEREGSLRAVSPDVGIELLMARQQAELAAQQQRLETSRLAAAQLIAEYAEFKTGAARSPAQELIGLDEIRDRIETLALNLKDEIMTFAPGGGHKAESIEASKPHDERLLSRGIRMRTTYLDSVRNSQVTLDYVTWLTALGGEVRTVPELPTRMIIFDRAAALIPVSSGDSASGAVVLTGQGTLDALCALFDSVWAQARPLCAPPESVRNDDGLTAQEATVLRLLAQGHTDEAIAKRLGVSPRTARRVSADLMERLDARSRFEFGVRAVQRGWLPSQF